MLSVAQLNEQVKTLLESTFGYVEVSGEISRLTKHGSGHWYFTLKDESASISAVMYRMNNAKLKFNACDGMKVVVYGKVSLYTANGSYQLIVTTLRPDGEGELELAFKQLKERLQREGMFDIDHKKPIPNLPKRVGLVTSVTSAALQDMLKIVRERWRLSEILIFDALTQGENAPNSLTKALIKADDYGLDVIVLARGGGSREDLWCFNDESLARVIFGLKTPIVSAIGHEIDYVISDFVADRRAPTPSAAMLELLPDEGAYFQYIDSICDEMDRAINLKLTSKKNELEFLSHKFSNKVLKAKLQTKFTEIDSMRMMYKNALLSKILKLGSNLKSLESAYETAGKFFESTSELTQIRVAGKKVTLDSLKIGDDIELVSQNTRKMAKITS
ncbi:exodeoxyribonuclease VII large subunit [Campylobacter sp. faydin G-140]|uniref:exodeoxyribonuclease VII large subunit n=1 Tax=Campylobacter anatolicus TaxID=2829105 RepID=UPI001BA1F8B3|nr:exodeoxyribonuclease VII large subunit [Campylobacter anatolicus]